jgi:predicted transcriptional regulator YdeE
VLSLDVFIFVLKQNEMEHTILEPFKIIGISIRTTNENGQSAKDIPLLWQKLMNENILTNIPNKIDNTIYSVYTDYEKDFTKPYTTLLGCKVNSLDIIPEGMVGYSFDGGVYKKFIAKGDLSKGVVINEWNKIWTMDLNRAYIADFEIYGEKSQDAQNAEVDILIALK